MVAGLRSDPGFLSVVMFLHDRPWISPPIRLISNELDTTIDVIASQWSGHCDVISNQLWRHRQNVNRTSETRGRCVQIVVLSPFMYILCRVTNKITSLDEKCVSWLKFHFGVYQINTKITLSWAHKQFATRVHNYTILIFESCDVQFASNYFANHISFSHTGQWLVFGYVYFSNNWAVNPLRDNSGFEILLPMRKLGFSKLRDSYSTKNMKYDNSLIFIEKFIQTTDKLWLDMI